VKLHRGPLKSHPEQKLHGSGLTLHEIVRTDPATYYTSERLVVEDKPTMEQEKDAVTKCRDRLHSLLLLAGDTGRPETARAWMVRDPDKKGLWHVHVMVMGTKKYDDVKEHLP
jgi:hypothetical protein